jgi:hypothetical protein
MEDSPPPRRAEDPPGTPAPVPLPSSILDAAPAAPVLPAPAAPVSTVKTPGTPAPVPLPSILDAAPAAPVLPAPAAPVSTVDALFQPTVKTPGTPAPPAPAPVPLASILDAAPAAPVLPAPAAPVLTVALFQPPTLKTDEVKELRAHRFKPTVNREDNKKLRSSKDGKQRTKKRELQIYKKRVSAGAAAPEEQQVGSFQSLCMPPSLLDNVQELPAPLPDDEDEDEMMDDALF